MFRRMAKGYGEGKDPLERWRHFELRYAERVAPFLQESGAPVLEKDDLVDLVSLRGKADRWRDRFFRDGYDRGAASGT